MTGQFRAGLLTACVVIMLATSATSAISGQTYYVSGNGNDAADGTSGRTAWATLARVAEHTFAAGDRLLLEGGVVHRGSIHLGPDRSADDIQIGSYGHGRAIIDAGTGSGIVIENLSAVKISDLEIRGSGQETNSGDGILITSHVDPIPANTVPYSGFVIHKVEVHGFKRFGILLHSRRGTGLRGARVTRAVSHDNGLEGITVLADEFPGTPNEDIYIGYSVAYHNHGTRGLPGHSGSGIVLGGVKRGMIEHSEVYESGDQSDGFQSMGPVGIWAWNSDQVIIQFCKSHDMATANNADGGGFDLDGGTTNSVIQYNVSWNNHGYGYQLYDFLWGPHSGNTVRYNVTIGDGKVTSSRRPTPGQGVLVGFGNLINESFHHNIAYVENEGESDVKLAQIDTWRGDGLVFHDNIYLAGNTIRPFDVIDSTGTNLKMFDNIYYLAEEPLPFHWNERVYNTIDEWRTEIDPDGSSQFLNIAYVDVRVPLVLKLAQIDTWRGDGLFFHDNIYLAGNTIRPFDVIDSTGTNLKMFDNIYYLAEEPLLSHWNERRVYNTIDEWRTEIGSDGSSQFLIGPLPPRGQRIRSALGALMREPTLQPEMFHKLHALAR